ncbi:substrate-binding domain-containing protein [Microbacterium sp. KRD172]|uniref:sugar ABC transporter substrate-binding protein n=1 Tax=Microbacterium sp. KRD172 TaxID=2729727 RepID=UPI0019D237E0|nr:substrate-binding domain-containing protein [Microbacterium sp. KRD172]
MKLAARPRHLVAGLGIAALMVGIAGCSSPADRQEGPAPEGAGQPTTTSSDPAIAALLEEVQGKSDLEALAFFESLDDMDLSDAQVIDFFVNLPLSDANQEIYDLYNSRGFANGAEAYPRAEMVDGFEWQSGMGTQITGPFTNQALKLPFSDEYIPLPEGPIGDPDETYTIGLLSGGLSDAWIANYQDSVGYEAARHENVTLDVRDYNFDMAKYSTEMDALIAQQVDAIVTWPMVESSSAAPVQRAEEAGIPVITADRTSGYKDVTSRVTGNFPANGAQNAMYLVWKLAQEGGGEAVDGNVVVLGKPAGSTADNTRGGFFLKVLSYFPGIEILKYENIDDNRQASAEAAQNAFATYDNIDAIFGADSNKAAVAAQAAEQAGRMTRANGEPLIIMSTDDAKEIFTLLDNGQVSVNTPYTPLIGDVQMRVALNVLAGNEVPRDVATPNIPMVTKDGVKIFGLQTLTPEAWFEYTFG